MIKILITLQKTKPEIDEFTAVEFSFKNQLHGSNVSNGTIVTVRSVFYVDVTDNRIMNIDDRLRLPIDIPEGRSIKFEKPLDGFRMNKLYKMVVYYGIGHRDYANQYELRITCKLPS